METINCLVCISFTVTMVKSREKKFKIYFRVTANSTNDMVKCHQNVNLKRLILSVQQKKMMDFDYYEEYLRNISNKNIIMAVLRKANPHSVGICVLIKKSQ